MCVSPEVELRSWSRWRFLAPDDHDDVFSPPPPSFVPITYIGCWVFPNSLPPSDLVHVTNVLEDFMHLQLSVPLPFLVLSAPLAFTFCCPRCAPQVLNPAYDYIPPNLVDLYITNMGGLQPSYIYRLLAEYYHRDDLIISPSDEQSA